MVFGKIKLLKLNCHRKFFPVRKEKIDIFVISKLNSIDPNSITPLKIKKCYLKEC